MQHVEESEKVITSEERKEKNKGLWMIVANHLLSALSHTSTHADMTELVADSKVNEEMEVEIDKLGPDQARSMLALLAGTGYRLNSAPCTL